jgi:hypothetical protein
MNGHRHRDTLRPKCANNGLVHRSKWRRMNWSSYSMTFTVIDDPGYRMSPSFRERRAFVEPNGTSDVLFRE